MKKLRIALSILFVFLHAQLITAQEVDIIFDAGIYKSYYSYGYQSPLYVTYYLYQGGGPCDREAEGMNFTKCGERTASNSDYTNSGYERGHLANAEDFAYDCEAEDATFCYYNCVPQTYEGNHGTWIKWESDIRKLSQEKELFIVAGAIYGTKCTKPGSKVRVPRYCYKIVIDYQTGELLHCLLFNNDKSTIYQNITLANLKKKLKYDLILDEDDGFEL